MPKGKQRTLAISIWVMGLAILVAACGDDGGDEEEARCVVEALTAGTYSFEVSKVDDKCAGGVVGKLLDGQLYALELPSYADLQAGPVDAVIPILGNEVNIRFELEGDEVQIFLRDGFESIVLFSGCSAVVSAQGSLCPLSRTEAKATLVLTLEALVGSCGFPEPDTPCDVTVQLEGEAQAG